MKILTHWLRSYLPALPVTDRELADDLTLRGIAVEGVHSLGPGPGSLFEMDITTNRVDAMNHYGIAREAAAIYNLPLSPLLPSQTLSSRPERSGVEGSASPEAPTKPTPIPIHIDPAATALCGRFTGRILRNVTIAPSTGQIKTFFDLLGQKPISNAVDASNFTLLGMGHPTHAFDLDTIDGGILVRLARPGEKLRLLDGTERTLEPDDLVIADHTRALSLAGVMGGWDSMITSATKNILVEAAWFDPAAIRRSSRRHLLHTDASHRFERGADFNAAPIANQLVTDLILQASVQSGGTPDGPLIDIVIPEAEARTAARPSIALSVAEVQRHLGTTIDDTPAASALTPALVTRYLTALGCTLTPAPVGAGGFSPLDPVLHGRGFSPGTPAPAAFQVQLPSWRLDLEREIDLIEEVARVHGYNRFANTLPTPLPILAHPTHAPERAVRTRLLALGFSETVSSTFAGPADSHLFAPQTYTAAHVPLENPLSEEASNLRPSLVPGMLAMLAHNLNRDVATARLFEQGHTFRAAGAAITEVEETVSLALGLTTAGPQPTLLHTAHDAPIFELKGIIESLASLFTLPGGPHALAFTTENTPAWLELGRSAIALLDGTPLARFGELSRSESARRKLRQPVFLAEIDLARLYDLPLRKVTAHELSRFQAVERDFSFLFPDSVQWHTVAVAIHALAIPDLQSLTPVEIFRDSPTSSKPKAVLPGHHSLLLRAIFQSLTRTLTDEELTASSTRIIEALTTLGGTLRSA